MSNLFVCLFIVVSNRLFFDYNHFEFITLIIGFKAEVDGKKFNPVFSK